MPAHPYNDVPTSWLHAQAIGRLCRAKPHVVIVPVVLCGLLMGFGVWVVILGADAQVDSERCA